MSTTTASLLNVLLVAGVVGALAGLVRLALRLPEGERPETLHPSQPLPLDLVSPEDEEPRLLRAA